VVEAALRSGSLVTARCALEQGREVFALPGPIGNPGCEGPHWLIKQGATPVTGVEDILDNLQYGLHWLPDDPEKQHYSSDQEKVALPFPKLLANVGDEVTPVDVVAERAGQPVPVTVAQLLELELAGWIAAVPGGYVRLRRHAMFDVLMYLFETYIHNEAEMRVDQDKLTRDLTDAGFEREDIYNALMWLEKLADYQEGLAEPMQLASDPLSVRIYTAEECERLDASCRGFILFLEQIQVLNLEREKW